MTQALAWVYSYLGSTSMAEVTEIRVSEQHLELARHLRIAWVVGGPGVNWKMPYGNGDVAADIIRILKLPVNKGCDDAVREMALALHQEMLYVSQIIMQYAGHGVIAGVYRRRLPFDSRSWEWIEGV